MGKGLETWREPRNKPYLRELRHRAQDADVSECDENADKVSTENSF